MLQKKKGRSFVGIMIFIAVIALFLRFGIEQVIKITISQNESFAQETLKLLATALENFAKDHLGVFPKSLSALIENNPPYIKKEYINLSYAKGYNYNCFRLEPAGYSCSASPLRCNLTGINTYTVSIGGYLVSEPCGKKE
jgi:hypothetical protein